MEAIDSPWLQMTLDTGNFLENSYGQMESMASSKVPIALVQAKTYFGGGRWYALELDYAKIAEILKVHGYKGWISLEFEGNEDPENRSAKEFGVIETEFCLGPKKGSQENDTYWRATIGHGGAVGQAPKMDNLE